MTTPPKEARLRGRIAVEHDHALREIVSPLGPDETSEREDAEALLKLWDDLVEELRREAYEETASREDFPL